MDFIIVTGMSGAGKSQAAKALEDIGFYCVDNIPPSMLPAFAELCWRGQSRKLSKVAVVTDVRGGELFEDINSVLDELLSGQIDIKILFLDAADEVLVRRYRETRHKHPLCDLKHISIINAVKKERELLRTVYARADYIIDTSQISSAQLKQRISSLFLGDASQALTIQCMSFGFKYGGLPEANLIFDVRCLPNPFYIDELRPLTGLNEPVRDYVLKFPQTEGYVERMLSLVDYSVPLYCSEGKSQLLIGIGCTGGKHRSVTLTELLYQHLQEKGYRVSVSHRDINKV
ncbi:MAG: RNase adapter RapZ [Clostridiales bacterium]|nr:RNase adapter RapZ [Clostridiales bacterium]